MKNFKQSFYSIASDIIDTEAHIPQRVLFATRTGKTVLIKDEIYENLKQQNFELISNDVLSKLMEIEAIVPSDQNELDFILRENEIAIDDNRSLGIVIQPGASCQLGCGYCGQQHTKNYMSELVQQQTIDRIESKLKTGAFDDLSITWYGGEPLMALKQIRAMSKQLISLAHKYNVKYGADMITNGLSLKEDIYQELVNEMKVSSFQITIDGTKEFHDTRRHTKENRPTFDIIFSNIVKITTNENYNKNKGNITIRCNIDNTNLEGLYPFIDLLVENNLQNKVGFYIAPIHNWGDNDAANIYGAAKNELASLEIDWMMELMNKGFSISILPSRTKIVCMVVNKESEVYDAFGNISTCWEIPYTPIFENTDYIIGNVSREASVKKDNIPMRDWNQEIETGPMTCNTCKLLPVCGGSCPKHWLAGTPACPTFKFNIEERLLLQYATHQANVKELSF